MADRREAIKERIRRLRQMTVENGASEGETLNALAAIERLMREHGLDDAELDARAPVQLVVPLGRARRQPVDVLIGAIGVFAEVECWTSRRRDAIAAVYFVLIRLSHTQELGVDDNQQRA